MGRSRDWVIGLMGTDYPYQLVREILMRGRLWVEVFFVLFWIDID